LANSELLQIDPVIESCPEQQSFLVGNHRCLPVFRGCAAHCLRSAQAGFQPAFNHVLGLGLNHDSSTALAALTSLSSDQAMSVFSEGEAMAQIFRQHSSEHLAADFPQFRGLGVLYLKQFWFINTLSASGSLSRRRMYRIHYPAPCCCRPQPPAGYTAETKPVLSCRSRNSRIGMPVNLPGRKGHGTVQNAELVNSSELE